MNDEAERPMNRAPTVRLATDPQYRDIEVLGPDRLRNARTATDARANPADRLAAQLRLIGVKR